MFSQRSILTYTKFAAVVMAALMGLLGAVDVSRGERLVPDQVYMTAYNAAYSNDVLLPIEGDSNGQNFRADVLAVLDDGIVDHSGTLSRVDTFHGDSGGHMTDFVGLSYADAHRFDTITIELGAQSSNGGDWDEMPSVYILQNTTLVSGQGLPERVPNWVELTGATLTTGHSFNPIVSPGAGGTITLDLSGIPAADRTGWGWAVGGVDGNSAGSGAGNFISFTEAYADGVSAAAPQPFVPATLEPTFVVSNRYRNVDFGNVDVDIGNRRSPGFLSVTDGIIDHNGQLSGFNTGNADFEGLVTDFVGLQYSAQATFDTITIDLDRQFVQGGDWVEMPRIFILKNPVDTGNAPPEDDPDNWLELNAADIVETTGHVFNSGVLVNGPGGTMTFDLTALSEADRTGYGWAVGGVQGNGTETFVHFTEVSATGTWFVPPPVQPGNADGDGDVDGADFVIWQTNFPFTPSSGAASVPESQAVILLAIAGLLTLPMHRCRKRHRQAAE